MDLATVVTNTFTTTGLIAFVSFIFRSWIKEKLSKAIKHEYDIKLEDHKARLSAENSLALAQFKAKIETEYEIVKAGLLRYSENQFEIYNELWAALCDLEVCADNLWKKANFSNLQDLSYQLKSVRINVRKSALLLETTHYKELNNILDQFEKFEFGKLYLIDLRSVDRNAIDQEEIDEAISNNQIQKSELSKILSDMMECMKSQLIEKI